MSFVPGDLVWTDFGAWYPGIVGTPDQLPTQGEEGQIPVIFSDGSGAFLDPALVEPFEKNMEERKNAPEAAEIWETFMAMVNRQKGSANEGGEEVFDFEDDDDLLLGGGEARDEDDNGEADEEERQRKKAEKLAKKARKEAEKAQKQKEKEERKAKKEKKDKHNKETDDADADHIAALLEEEGGSIDAATASRMGNERLVRASDTNIVRRSQIANAQHLEQPAGRIAELQLALVKAHYNNVLASEVAGTSTRLMPFHERDYVNTAEKAIQRRARTERFLSLALKKANDEGKGHTPAAKAIKESHEALRTFDLTKAFALPIADINPAVRRQLAADAVEVRSIPRAVETAPGPEKLKHVTRLYYRDPLTSIADGTSLVPIEPMPARGIRAVRGSAADPIRTRLSTLTGGLGTQGLSQGSALLTGRFASTASASQLAPLLLQANKETEVMSQWRLFRELPPRDDHHDAQYIPPVGAIAQRFDEAGQELWTKAYRRTLRTLRDNDKLILNATAQTTEARLGLNIGYNDIPAAGGPPAGPEDVEDMAADRDVIARQLRELGETLDRERATQVTGAKSQLRSEAAQAFLELTQRAGALDKNSQTQQNTQQNHPATQFNFHDFGAEATQKREQRASFGSVDYASGVPMESLGSHLVGVSNMPNPLTPVNYGYDLEEAFRTTAPADGAEDIRSLQSNDLPSVNSLWEKGSIAVVDSTGLTQPRSSQNANGTPANAAGRFNPAKIIREIFLKEAKTLTITIEKLLAQGNPSTSYRSSNSGHMIKYSSLRDVLEYLRDVGNVRAIVEKLTARAMEQISGKLAIRDPSDESPLFSSREAYQLAASFRRQIERAHRVDRDGLTQLVPSNISRPASDARSVHSEAARSAVSRHSRSTTGVSVRSSAVGQRRSRERAYDE